MNIENYYLSPKSVKKIESSLQVFNGNTEDPGWADQCLEVYRRVMGLDNCHILTLNNEMVAKLHENINYRFVKKIYEEYSDYDIWLPHNMQLPPAPIPLLLSRDDTEKLSRFNPLYEQLNKVVSGGYFMTAISHPSSVGMGGAAWDREDFNDEEKVIHSIISPAFISNYAQKRNISIYRSLSEYCSEHEERNSSPCCIISTTGECYYISEEFRKTLEKLYLSLSEIVQLLATNSGPSLFIQPRNQRISLGASVILSVSPLKLTSDCETLLKLSLEDQRVAAITRQEQHVVNLIRSGASNREIAQKLLISENTVKKHVYSIFQKTGVKNRVELCIGRY